jgi:hypothetical protein
MFSNERCNVEETLIYLESAEANEGNPLVECPVCHVRGRLMDDFSYLQAGFNGIQDGDADDVDMQECPNGHKLNWEEPDEEVS